MERQPENRMRAAFNRVIVKANPIVLREPFANLFADLPADQLFRLVDPHGPGAQNRHQIA